MVLALDGLCLAGDLDLKTTDLGETDRQLNNPLTSIWSLTFQKKGLGFKAEEIEQLKVRLLE